MDARDDQAYRSPGECGLALLYAAKHKVPSHSAPKTQFPPTHAGMTLRLQVRIFSTDGRGVLFTVESETGEELLRTETFPTVCRLEHALSKLCTCAGTSQVGRSVQLDPSKLVISGPGGQLRLRLSQQAMATKIDAMLDSLPNAQLIDERDPRRRRVDLSGPLQHLIGLHS